MKSRYSPHVAGSDWRLQRSFAKEWRRTPWWHYRRWVFGQTWTRWTWRYDPPSAGDPYYDGKWQYQTDNERAREALEEAYGRE